MRDVPPGVEHQLPWRRQGLAFAFAVAVAVAVAAFMLAVVACVVAALALATAATAWVAALVVPAACAAAAHHHHGSCRWGLVVFGVAAGPQTASAGAVTGGGDKHRDHGLEGSAGGFVAQELNVLKVRDEGAWGRDLDAAELNETKHAGPGVCVPGRRREGGEAGHRFLQQRKGPGLQPACLLQLVPTALALALVPTFRALGIAVCAGVCPRTRSAGRVGRIASTGAITGCPASAVLCAAVATTVGLLLLVGGFVVLVLVVLFLVLLGRLAPLLPACKRSSGDHSPLLPAVRRQGRQIRVGVVEDGDGHLGGHEEDLVRTALKGQQPVLVPGVFATWHGAAHTGHASAPVKPPSGGSQRRRGRGWQRML